MALSFLRWARDFHRRALAPQTVRRLGSTHVMITFTRDEVKALAEYSTAYRLEDADMRTRLAYSHGNGKLQQAAHS